MIKYFILVITLIFLFLYIIEKVNNNTNKYNIIIINHNKYQVIIIKNTNNNYEKIYKIYKI
jgi:hypothetical protein